MDLTIWIEPYVEATTKRWYRYITMKIWDITRKIYWIYWNLGKVKKHIPSGNQTISTISQPFDDFLNQSSTFRQVLELVHVKQTGPFLRS